jgi:Protein of unknown function (DUF2935).
MDIFCRGVKPFPPLALAEVCFWLRIMRDHALFIDLGLPAADTALKLEAQGFFAVFGDLEKHAAAAGNEEDFCRLVTASIVAVQRFFAFNRHILHLIVECRMCGGWLYPLFVDHLSREALYFRKLLKKLVDGGMKYQVDAVVSENIFWARGIADHAKFLHSLIDPSERAVLCLAETTGAKFDSLDLRARDLASMLWHYRPNNALVGFEKEFRLAVQDANDFVAMTGSLVARCAAATIIPPLLADHIHREGEHCLAVLELIRQYLLRDDEAPLCGEDGDED